MMQSILIGIGAGVASALLFASVASGSPLSVPLFYLAPLPILIAALGWSHWAALVAALAASAALASVFSPIFFIGFSIGIGLPAWWLGYLTLLARPSAQTLDGLEWYPVGHLVVWAAMLSALVVIAGIFNFGFDEQSFRSSLRGVLERMLHLQGQTISGGDDGAARSGRLLDFLVTALPLAAAVLTTITNIGNLWLASRVVRISGRLRRPPPDLAAMRFPRYAPALTGLAIAGSFVEGLVGIAAGVVGAAMMMAYAILGFAVLHTITRGLSSRPFVLAGVYGAVIVFGWPVLVMTMLGLADAAFDLRGRVTRKRGPPPPPAWT